MPVPLPVLAAGAGAGAFLLGKLIAGGSGSGTADPAAAAPASPTSPANGSDQIDASVQFPGVLEGVNQGSGFDSGGLTGDAGGTVDPPFPLPAPAWWAPVSYIGAPPSNATFAIHFSAGTYWRVDSAGNHVATFNTGGFAAYGNSISTKLGRQIGKLLTGSRAGWWVILSQGTVYRK